MQRSKAQIEYVKWTGINRSRISGERAFSVRCTPYRLCNEAGDDGGSCS